jgi:hypothetical protein
MLRGKEGAGRWELLVACPTTRRRSTADVLLGMSLSVGAMYRSAAVEVI